MNKGILMKPVTINHWKVHMTFRRLLF